MFAAAPVRGRQDARRTLGGLNIHDYDEALLFYIFYEQLFRMSIAGERCFGVGEPCYARHFPNKGSTMDPQDVHWATGGLYHEWLNILHLLTFSLSLSPVLSSWGRLQSLKLWWRFADRIFSFYSNIAPLWQDLKMFTDHSLCELHYTKLELRITIYNL